MTDKEIKDILSGKHTCKNCKYNYGLRENKEYNPEDIVCDYWESDGLTEKDFCSQWKENKQ